MHSVLRVLALALVCGPGFAAGAAATGPADDDDAPSIAARLLETLGGAPAWAAARSIRVELRGYYAREHRPWTETYWMDLEAARGRFELRGGDADRTIAWTPEGGWEEKDGAVEPMSGARHDLEMAYWRRQPAVLFRRLAQGEIEIRAAEGTDETAVEAVDLASAEVLARFVLNLESEPTKWRARIGEHEIDHLLGPLATYGRIHFPAWGGSVDGIWRYDHLTIELSDSPFDASVEPPSPPKADSASSQADSDRERR